MGPPQADLPFTGLSIGGHVLYAATGVLLRQSYDVLNELPCND